MPGDLSNPAFLFPYHYDPRYDPGTNVFETSPLTIDQIIRSIYRSERTCPPKEMSGVYNYLESRNLLNRNPGDQEVQDAIRGYIRSKARKVASRWLTSTIN